MATPYCPVCNPNGKRKETNGNCYFCRGTGVVADPSRVEQAEEERARIVEQNLLDMTR